MIEHFVGHWPVSCLQLFILVNLFPCSGHSSPSSRYASMHSPPWSWIYGWDQSRETTTQRSQIAIGLTRGNWKWRAMCKINIYGRTRNCNLVPWWTVFYLGLSQPSDCLPHRIAYTVSRWMTWMDGNMEIAIVSTPSASSLLVTHPTSHQYHHRHRRSLRDVDNWTERNCTDTERQRT